MIEFLDSKETPFQIVP